VKVPQKRSNSENRKRFWDQAKAPEKIRNSRKDEKKRNKKERKKIPYRGRSEGQGTLEPRRNSTNVKGQRIFWTHLATGPGDRVKTKKKGPSRTKSGKKNRTGWMPGQGLKKTKITANRQPQRKPKKYQGICKARKKNIAL